MPKPHLICIVGPTASGKTAAAVVLGQWFNTEVISADARQFYAELSIGTAKPSLAELSDVPHALLGHVPLEAHYHVADFERDALVELDRIFASNKVAILVGGSGLYVKTLLYGIDQLPEVDPEIRANLKAEFEQSGLPPLVEELKIRDPDYAQQADLNNAARVIRALEVCRQTGKPFSSFRQGKPVPRPFDFSLWGIDWPRAQLYARIDQRVLQMVQNGLLEEAQQFMDLRELKALQTIGYRELWPYLDGHVTLEEAIQQIQQNTRRFAKRQMTYFRNQLEVNWFQDDVRLIEGIKQSWLA